MARVFSILTNLFPVWVTVCCVVAMFKPAWFTWFGGPAIGWGLAVIMLGMGITLRFDDFLKVAKTPRPILLGVAAQFLIMPALGWSIARGFSLERDLAVGLILVSCCPGGTASNVVAYLARANVALSVLMTMCSTFVAIFMTPVLTKALAGTLVEVSASGLFLSTVKVVLAPVVIGMALHHASPKIVRAVTPVSPFVSVVAIVLICASIIGANAEAVRESALKLLAAVFLLHCFGFALGYLTGRFFGYGPTIRRTVSIEVGMQNSGLGSVLATTHFVPLTAVPCSISAAFHSVIGSILAGIWRMRPDKSDKTCAPAEPAYFLKFSFGTRPICRPPALPSIMVCSRSAMRPAISINASLSATSK